MPVAAEELYAWHARPLAFQRLVPPWEDVEVTEVTGSFGTDGHRVTLRSRILGPIRSTWVAELYDFQPGRQFRDRQVRGPFASWEHTHRFLPGGPDASILQDTIEYRLPLGWLGRQVGGGLVRRRLEAMFRYRHALTAADLRRHKLYRDRPRLSVLVTGSRGLIGSSLVAFLVTGGHRVVRLVTGPGRPPFDDGTTWVNWDPYTPLPPGTLDGIDAVVHLAGDNIATGRWTARKKQRIRDSRVIPTGHLAEAIAAAPADRRPRVFVSASAVGYYGNRGDELLTEDAPPGTGFFPDVSRDWEAATEPARRAGVRTVHLRFGVVLSPRGGALAKQLFAFRIGAGAVLGPGTQWLPWVACPDAVAAIHHALMTDTLHGPVNVCAPEPVTNRTFTQALGRVLQRPAFLWLPRFALRLLFGEIADHALLASIRAVPRRLLDSGFTFDLPDLEAALRFVLGR